MASASTRIAAVELQQQLTKIGVRANLHGYTFTLLPLYQLRSLDVIPRDLEGFVANGTLPFDSVEHWRFRIPQ